MFKPTYLCIVLYALIKQKFFNTQYDMYRIIHIAYGMILLTILTLIRIVCSPKHYPIKRYVKIFSQYFLLSELACNFFFPKLTMDMIFFLKRQLRFPNHIQTHNCIKFNYLQKRQHNLYYMIIEVIYLNLIENPNINI